MKKLVLCYIVALLGVIILSLAIYFFSTKGYNRQADVVFAVGTLCLSAALPGAIIAQSKVHVITFSSLIVIGIALLGLNTASLIHLEVQDMNYGRTIPIFELFIVWLLGTLVTTIIIRHKRYSSYFAIAAIGILALCIGVYLLITMNYHERAYIALGTGCICVLISLIGLIVLQRRTFQIKS